MNIFPFFIIALLFTIIFEFGIAVIFLRKNIFHILIAIIIVNLITNPIMNYLYIYESVNIIVLETAVIAVESILIAFLLRLSYLRALMLSIIMNLLSFGFGYLVSPYLFFR